MAKRILTSDTEATYNNDDMVKKRIDDIENKVNFIEEVIKLENSSVITREEFDQLAVLVKKVHNKLFPPA